MVESDLRVEEGRDELEELEGELSASPERLRVGEGDDEKNELGRKTDILLDADGSHVESWGKDKGKVGRREGRRAGGSDRSARSTPGTLSFAARKRSDQNLDEMSENSLRLKTRRGCWSCNSFLWMRV